MNSQARSLSGALLCAGLTLVIASKPAIAQTDSTLFNLLKSSEKISVRGGIPSMGPYQVDQDWVGRRLRLTAPTLLNGEVKGRVSAVAGDTLVIEQYKHGESNYLRIPFSSISRCRIQDGTRSNVLAGALIGLGLGAGITAAATLPDDFADHKAATIALGSGGGLIAGCLIGSLVKSDRWKGVPIGNLRLGAGPLNGVLGMTLSVRF